MAITELSRSSERMQGLGIPNPAIDPVGEARAFYGEYYQHQENDSPDLSRSSLVRRAQNELTKLKPKDTIIDLGAGKQILEAEHHTSLGAAKVVTIDVANVKNDQLLAARNPNTYHIQASGDAIPLPDEAASVVLSNMAFDFMPDGAKAELHRVLKPGASAFLNLHHPSIIPFDLEQIRNNMRRKISNRIRFGSSRDLTKDRISLAALDHKSFLQKNGKLFDSSENIRESFASAGFEVRKISLGEDEKGDKWWEVDIRKPREASLGNGERRLPHNRRREVIETEREIHTRRWKITQINAELATMNNALKIGETTDEMEQRREVILFQRRTLSSEQTFARQEIRGYKTPQPIED